jgi:hypothetical protein
MMKLYAADRSELMQISAIERDGSDLLIKGKVFGTMPMTARLTPDQARQGLKLLRFRLLMFVITMLLRRGA